jgi:hypothetical protein
MSSRTPHRVRSSLPGRLMRRLAENPGLVRQPRRSGPLRTGCPAKDIPCPRSRAFLPRARSRAGAEGALFRSSDARHWVGRVVSGAHATRATMHVMPAVAHGSARGPDECDAPGTKPQRPGDGVLIPGLVPQDHSLDIMLPTMRRASEVPSSPETRVRPVSDRLSPASSRSVGWSGNTGFVALLNRSLGAEGEAATLAGRHARGDQLRL